MAYPTQSLSLVLSEIDRTMLSVRQQAVRVRDKSAVQSLGSTEIFDVVINLRNARARLVSLSNTAGLVEYAQQQKNDGTLDVSAEFTAVTAAVDAVVSWVEVNFPKHNSGGTDYLLSQTLGADGPVDRRFTPASLATFRVQLDALIATIGV